MGHHHRKIIFLTYIPSPYRVDFFNELAKYRKLKVVYYCENMPNSPWAHSVKKHNYSNIFLFKKSKLKGLALLLNILYKNRNETIVIGGYSKLAEIISIFFLKLFKIEFVLNSDGGFVTNGFMKTLLKKKLIKSASYWLSSGVNTTNTLKHYKAKSSNIFEYHFSPLFENEILKKRIVGDERVKLRSNLNLKIDVCYLVFVGQLIDRKGVDILIDAIPLMNNKKIEVLIIGDGDKLSMLKEKCYDLNLNDNVHFIGKCAKNKVLEYLKVSNVFVFPSREDIWGLVLNEAIAYGLPVISTKQVGSAYSLIDHGQNGYLIDSDDAFELAEALDKLLLMNIDSMGSKSIEKAQKYSIENMVQDHLRLFERFD
jgi:glycosyltransferase involved in cell wall biosynthesis